MPYQTEQEAFWAGQFGQDYITRNRSDKLLASNLALFARVLRSAQPIASCIELGANIGMNLRALKRLQPEAELHAVEVNPKAAEELSQVVSAENVYCASVLEFAPARQWDLALTKGLLIHINPEHLATVYDLLHAASSRYVLVCEYYNRSPIAIPYRGEADRLFKRDFGGEMLDRFDDLELIDYGFAYHRDPRFPQDDISWFLMEKRP